MRAQMLEMSPLGVGTVLRLERDAWSIDKGLSKQQMNLPTPHARYLDDAHIRRPTRIIQPAVRCASYRDWLLRERPKMLLSLADDPNTNNISLH